MTATIQPDAILRGPVFSEPVKVISVKAVGTSLKIIGRGVVTGKTHDPILSAKQIELLQVSPPQGLFDGDGLKFKLGVEALRIGLAYEYDPYFSLSIARVDPLPHQLEAVYDYFLKLPRIKFLLADDPGAGKTVMAGLLIKELKIRGLIRRVLIVTPANLTFQWQRELKDKFREDFNVIRGEVLRMNYGQNPWQENNQVITSISWASLVEDARESLLRSHWDLVIVDEAHKMSAYSSDKKTYAYELGERLSEATDHLLLMTATPHKGDPKNFALFLQLLDRDVYADVTSLEEAMKRNEAPFYLRRTKEALVTFPDPETGEVKKLYTKRHVDTIGFKIADDEYDFYAALTRYVEDQSIKAASENSARGRALGFTMAMLQRRFASSLNAVRASLERMRKRRQEILENPEAYRKNQIERNIPEDFEEWAAEDREKLIEDLEAIIPVLDREALGDEIGVLGDLIGQASALQASEVETKLKVLKTFIAEQGFLENRDLKLLIFTEHKDTLDFLVAKLREWGLTVTQIHGGMKIGDRDTPGTRIHAEKEFKESAQVMVATEAAGEGINLQFCWFLINYDIPWNPVRLEQRMGRIHRYGQKNDCLIFNFVSTNTREGRVLDTLLKKLTEIRSELQTDQVFDVVGEILPTNRLEKLFREMYAKNTSEKDITDRIVKDFDPERFRRITNSTLEGLAKKNLNLSSLIGRREEAKARRLVPEVIEDFFRKAGMSVGATPQPVRGRPGTYRLPRLPHHVQTRGEELEPRFGKLGREYRQFAFDRVLVENDQTLEWVTPGHPLFEAVREQTAREAQNHFESGAVFFDIRAENPYRLDVFTSNVNDGRGNTLHRQLSVVRVGLDGEMTLKQATLFLDLTPATQGTAIPDGASDLPPADDTEIFLVGEALQHALDEIAGQRAKENANVRRHVEISLNALINHQQVRIGEMEEENLRGELPLHAEGNLKQAYDRVEMLNRRLETRLAELEQEGHCFIGDVRLVGSAWVLPHPARELPENAPAVGDADIERIAVQVAIEHETARGWMVESVEADNLGFDLISRRPAPDDPTKFLETRFIEVKGRAAVGDVALTPNEFQKAAMLQEDYWLYVVFDCATDPNLNIIRNPAKLGWKPLVKIEHYQVPASTILSAVTETKEN
jgi:superfamily II DNA or RNA helicase